MEDAAPVRRGDGPLRIAVHDFGGYAFPVELSRALARRGYVVRHFVCDDVFAGKAELRRLNDDSAALSFERVAASSAPVRKYDPLRRIRWEWDYGRQVGRRIERFQADLVLSANTPLIAQKRLLAQLGSEVARVIWLQDLVSVAIERHIAARSRLLGAVVAPLLRRLEIALARDADHLVAIAPHFTRFLTANGIEATRITEIRNWAPVGDIPVGSRMNSWRGDRGYGDDFLVVYSGTLGLKHDPLVLADIAKRLPHGARMVVLAEGPGVDRLRDHAAGITNLELLPFVRYEELPDVLAAADVFVALLEPDASSFSVPSKVLTYLCAARPIVASVPDDNLAALILGSESGGGIVVKPGDSNGLSEAVDGLRLDRHRALGMGRAGRRYAEHEFDVGRITDRFLVVLERALAERAQRRGEEPAFSPTSHLDRAVAPAERAVIE